MAGPFWNYIPGNGLNNAMPEIIKQDQNGPRWSLPIEHQILANHFSLLPSNEIPGFNQKTANHNVSGLNTSQQNQLFPDIAPPCQLTHSLKSQHPNETIKNQSFAHHYGHKPVFQNTNDGNQWMDFTNSSSSNGNNLLQCPKSEFNTMSNAVEMSSPIFQLESYDRTVFPETERLSAFIDNASTMHSMHDFPFLEPQSTNYPSAFRVVRNSRSGFNKKLTKREKNDCHQHPILSSAIPHLHRTSFEKFPTHSIATYKNQAIQNTVKTDDSESQIKCVFTDSNDRIDHRKSAICKESETKKAEIDNGDNPKIDKIQDCQLNDGIMIYENELVLSPPVLELNQNVIMAEEYEKKNLPNEGYGTFRSNDVNNITHSIPQQKFKNSCSPIYASKPRTRRSYEQKHKERIELMNKNWSRVDRMLADVINKDEIEKTTECLKLMMYRIYNEIAAKNNEYESFFDFYQDQVTKASELTEIEQNY
ncbi:unnamed protein product [Caenorhabditis brenneri]